MITQQLPFSLKCKKQGKKSWGLAKERLDSHNPEGEKLHGIHMQSVDN